MKPEDIHTSHDVRDEGLLISDPVCQTCRRAVPDKALMVPCVPLCPLPPAGWHCTRAAGHDGPCAADPITFTPQAIDELEPVRVEIVRVLRVLEYIGNREDVEAQVARSIHGQKSFARGCTIRAATIGVYPEILRPGDS
jgi:hypothetical protein